MDPRTPVDLTNCDREPIHLLGAIQPVGFLLALSSDWMIVRASANAADYLGGTLEDLIGHPLADIFTREAVHNLRNRLAMLRGSDAVERLFGCALTRSQEKFDVALHIANGQIVIEAETASEEHGDATGTVRAMIARLDQAETMEAFFGEGARQVRALTGYDRVMVYRFAPNGSGEVVAESAKPGIGSFLGMHYPASDIPVQARALYKRNLLRVISDIGASPVPIFPERDEMGHPIDLSLSILRSVSPIHIEYLKNMGVGASMSISILVDGQLWGLFACHHYSARRVSFERRSVCELFSQMFSMRLESRERQETVEFERRARDISDQLLGAVASDETLLENPEWLSDILTNAIPADGVGVWINGAYAFTGRTPSTEEFARIIKALNGTAGGKVYATDSIASIVPGAERFAGSAAGMLALPISRTPRDYVVLFRQEIVRSVRWAGDPHKPVEYGPNGPRLTPRKSFDEWKELVEGHSKPFTPSELRVAETLRATLIEVVLRLSDEASAERAAANARQELLIAELNHRVRNILGVIRGLIRQSKPSSGTIEDFVKLVDGRVHALARAHNQITEDHWGPAPLRALLDAESAAFLSDRGDRISIEGPPVLLNPQAYSTMALVVHELVTNSVKYGALSDGGRVEIGWWLENNGDLTIEWCEREGPIVAPPARKGFGTTIIDRSIPYDLGGTARVRFLPSGVEAIFRIPARHVAHAPDAPLKVDLPRQAAPVPATPEKTDAALAGKTVLLVEDSLIIALDAEDILQRLGAEAVITASNVANALVELGDYRPALAMLDINLGDQTSFPIADRLEELGIPFLFATGYGEQAQLPPGHKARVVLQKPYTLANVARALPQLLAPAEMEAAQ
jgi:light-regulated signal transduction histidine kinase (bacteriophytochrome)/ActR/RegA family two-component response regulator